MHTKVGGVKAVKLQISGKAFQGEPLVRLKFGVYRQFSFNKILVFKDFLKSSLPDRQPTDFLRLQSL